MDTDYYFDTYFDNSADAGGANALTAAQTAIQCFTRFNASWSFWSGQPNVAGAYAHAHCSRNPGLYQGTFAGGNDIGFAIVKGLSCSIAATASEFLSLSLSTASADVASASQSTPTPLPLPPASTLSSCPARALVRTSAELNSSPLLTLHHLQASTTVGAATELPHASFLGVRIAWEVEVGLEHLLSFSS